MDNHPGCLIDNHNIFVLKKDIERDILWYQFNIPGGIGQHNLNKIIRLYPVVWFNRDIVYKNISGIGSILYPCP